MKDQNSDQVVTQILQEAPTARKALLDNYTNLLNVAQYCHDNYLQTGDNSMMALEETKNFTTQSLASIAYQISTLANNMLSLFEAQTNQLRRMESSINLIGQTVEMHKEKVSRREIGVFTSVRRLPRSIKLLPPSLTPAGVQTRPAYSRQPINYQLLDHLGHGMKVSGKKENAGNIHQYSASFRSNKTPEPVQCPVSPAVSSSFGKPVAPPTIPTTWLASPDDDIIKSVLNDAPPPFPTLSEVTAPDNDFMNIPAPPPPPPPPSDFGDIIPLQPPSDVLTNPEAIPPAPPLHLETVVEESSSLPPSPPPPPADEFMFCPLSNGDEELPAPLPPPPLQELDASTSSSRRSRHRCSVPAMRSLSLRVRSGRASRCLNTRSFFLPAVQPFMIPPPPPYPPPCAPPDHAHSAARPRLPAHLQHLDLEIPLLPPPLPLDEDGFDDITCSFPPPLVDDSGTEPHYLEKVVALYSYTADKPEDLTLTEGDVIFLTHRHSDGWCQGFLNGKEGFFPESYIQSQN